ncbi:hypothetical protein SADUNF_Sadunf08G0095100 [Salix dunnii]|uniref:Uncharacterized protein n=1 Tax=Salix dunnii TaxID=1413687 RepID=A0A835MTU3_9ROSI|nr:hypothetical protein SADUNF_Sadunf08G0095100 [Salix dunnii]
MNSASMGSSKRRISSKGLGAALREQRARLYIIRRCVVHLCAISAEGDVGDPLFSCLDHYKVNKFECYSCLPQKHRKSSKTFCRFGWLSEEKVGLDRGSHVRDRERGLAAMILHRALPV